MLISLAWTPHFRMLLPTPSGFRGIGGKTTKNLSCIFPVTLSDASPPPPHPTSKIWWLAKMMEFAANKMKQVCRPQGSS